MFFNCNWCCRCRHSNIQEKNYYDKYEYNRCDKHSNHNECDFRDDKHDKCEYDKKEKCCCHINHEKKYYCDKDNRDEKRDNYNSNNRFEGQGYYCECNKLGYFNAQENCDYDNNNYRKPCQKEQNSNNSIYEKNCYTPDWESDKDCRCKKDKCDKDKNDNKYCKPVKYICIPCDKY